MVPWWFFPVGWFKLTGISLVSVHLEIALCQLKVGLWNDLVEGEFAAAEDLAGAAVAEDVLFFGDFHRPCGLAAVALPFVRSHGSRAVVAAFAVSGSGRDVTGNVRLQD